MPTTYERPPFLDVQTFAQSEAETPPPVRPATPAWSPFLSVYESDQGENLAEEPIREAYSTLVNNLYDEEFEESLFELLTSARGLHEDHLASGHSLADADRLVAQHFSQLMRESESMLDAMAREFESRDLEVVDREIDHFAESYAPASGLEPEFQDFLGKLVSKIGKGLRTVAKTAVKGITALGLGPILNRIKALVRPLLNQVLQKAIGRLPEAVQPVARKLAERLGLAPKAPAPAAPPATLPSDAASFSTQSTEPAAAPGASDPSADAAGSPVQPAAGTDVSEMQLEFDERLAEAMLAGDEPELELELARARGSSNGASTPVFSELDQARERLIHELDSLKEGENAAPYVENFLPAVLPALKIATRLIGRPRIVSFLAGLLGKVISNLVGPEHAPALSRAMVDAGLKLINLEVTDQEDTRLASTAVAATLEETLTRVASLPDHVLDNQELLEGFALEAFEQAAAANLPAVFSAGIYRNRPICSKAA
jgi:hypothetical protein